MGNVSNSSHLAETVRRYLATPAALIALTLVSVSIPMAGLLFGVKVSMVMLAGIAGIPILLLTFNDLKFGVTAILVISFILQGLNKYVRGVPLGITLDIFISVMFLAMIIKKRRNFDLLLTNNAIGIMVIVWISYNVLMIFNPLASIQAWVYVIRGIAILLLLYFVIANTLDSISFFRRLLLIWIAFSLLGAVYGLKQEYIGLSQFELDWVTADPFRYKLIHNWGRFRIFSFFNDPTVYGILMSYSCLFCIILGLGPFKMKYKVALFVASGLMFLAMVYAGTRTAFAMLPAGFLFFALLTLRFKTLAATFAFLLIGAFIIFSDISSIGPLGSNSLNRIRSAFNPAEDPSYRVRQRSQAFIKPYIQEHPIGAGLGSIGIWGSRFNPDSELAEFAPDSGYVRIAVELGWVGLILYCLFFFVILAHGISEYFRLKDPELKTYMAGIICVIFSLVIANYPQQVLIQVPTVTIFYMLMAMIVKARSLETT